MGFWGNLFGGKPRKNRQDTVTHGAPEQQTNSAVTMEIDPVCGMQVDPRNAPASSEYMGKNYYFCAPGCKRTFDANPGKFAESGGQSMSGHHHGGCC